MFVALLVLTAGCAGVRVAGDDPASAAKQQAEQWVRAGLTRDFARLIDMTYPKAVEAGGGRERAIAIVRAKTKELEDEGATLRSMTVGSPSQIVSERDTMYAVLPTTATTMLQGRPHSATSSILGVSTDGGRTWTFMDGTSLVHRETREKFFPSLPATLTVPFPTVSP